MQGIQQFTSVVLRTLAAPAKIHLATRELPGEGIEGACGQRSGELPLEHSFTTVQDDVTCRRCMSRPDAPPDYRWAYEIIYPGWAR